eukprot:9233852-Pyramimonas_sp.AAC.2
MKSLRGGWLQGLGSLPNPVRGVLRALGICVVDAVAQCHVDPEVHAPVHRALRPKLLIRTGCNHCSQWDSLPWPTWPLAGSARTLAMESY